MFEDSFLELRGMTMMVQVRVIVRCDSSFVILPRQAEWKIADKKNIHHVDGDAAEPFLLVLTRGRRCSRV